MSAPASKPYKNRMAWSLSVAIFTGSGAAIVTHGNPVGVVLLILAAGVVGASVALDLKAVDES